MVQGIQAMMLEELKLWPGAGCFSRFQGFNLDAFRPFHQALLLHHYSSVEVFNVNPRHKKAIISLLYQSDIKVF
jgi:hypothetical protein